tara:strand:+ start:3211 stop:4455 length:1245 start_codon:yes stop_codon:yes gene_type:complete
MTRAAAQYVDLKDLIPNPRNPRKDLPVKEVAKSIQEFGFGAPIVARLASKVIIAGNARYYASKEILKLDSVPCRYMDISEKAAIKMGLADNKIGELAKWHDEMLAELLAELEKTEDIADLGWQEAELDKLLADLRADLPAPEEKIEAPEEQPDSKDGEIYMLGHHILICGDASDEKTWSALRIAGKSFEQAPPVMALTDPPYDVGYNISWAKKRSGNDAGLQTNYQEAGPKRWSTAPDDPLALQPTSIIGAVLPLMPDLVVMTFPVDRHLFQLAEHIQNADYVSVRELVWCKSGASFHPAAAYQQQHEPVLILRRKGQKYPATIPAGTSTVIQSEEKMPIHTDHPTEKPIDVWLKLLKWHTYPGDTVIDPFAGSGTTLIAADIAGRFALLIEKNPFFCDLIRRRWTAHCCQGEK